MVVCMSWIRRGNAFRGLKFDFGIRQLGFKIWFFFRPCVVTLSKLLKLPNFPLNYSREIYAYHFVSSLQQYSKEGIVLSNVNGFLHLGTADISGSIFLFLWETVLCIVGLCNSLQDLYPWLPFQIVTIRNILWQCQKSPGLGGLVMVIVGIDALLENHRV